MSKVYFKSLDSYHKTKEISQAAEELLEAVVKNENVSLEKFVPLKVTFGEKGNQTFIGSRNFEGVIHYLQERGIDSAFIETNVLYRGQRTCKSDHIKTAEEHGFTQLPVIIADGEYGESYEEVEINKKHFKTCKIGKEIADQKQMIVMNHFKGHILAGFGGAIKQLAMGCAARGGKLAQHATSIPKINSRKCKVCGLCAKKCQENAIEVTTKTAKINKDKCVGCAACIAVCPHKATNYSFLGSLSGNFFERLAEYAYAAAANKNHIYISYAFNITRGCDCEGHKMKPIVGDLGVFASLDPVAIDTACLDLLKKQNNKTVFRRGRRTLTYGESIGLGSTKYELIEL